MGGRITVKKIREKKNSMECCTSISKDIRALTGNETELLPEYGTVAFHFSEPIKAI